MNSAFWMGAGGVGLALSVVYFEYFGNSWLGYFLVIAGLVCFGISGIFHFIESRKSDKEKDELFEILNDIKKELVNMNNNGAKKK